MATRLAIAQIVGLVGRDVSLRTILVASTLSLHVSLELVLIEHGRIHLRLRRDRGLQRIHLHAESSVLRLLRRISFDAYVATG